MKRYILFDKNQEMVDAWREFFEGRSDVEVLQCDINSITCDAIVSPANSFGFMDGGIDYAISGRLGWDLQKRLQHIIKGHLKKLGIFRRSHFVIPEFTGVNEDFTK